MVPIYEARPDNANIFVSHDLTFPPHIHSHIEMTYVRSGAIEVCIDGEAHVMRAGELAVMFPNQVHSYQSQGEFAMSGGNEIVVAMFPVEMSGELMGMMLKQYPENSFFDKAAVHEDIIMALNSCLKYRETDSSNLVVRAYLFLMLAHILSEVKLKAHEESHLMGYTERIVSYIASHFCEPVSLSQLSQLLGISKYSISRIIHNKLHTSFSEYVNSLRINHAEMLLLTTEDKIITVGLNSGYDTLRTFNREFSRFCGCSPKQYRERHGIILGSVSR